MRLHVQTLPADGTCCACAGSVADDLSTASGVSQYVAAFYFTVTFISTIG